MSIFQSRSILLKFVTFTAITLGVFCQEVLTNEGIINLVKSGMGEELILSVISKQPGSFSLGASDLVALKNAGVSERLIEAMLNKATDSAPAAPGPSATNPSPPPVTALPSTGVFYRKNNNSLELLSEEVEWKSSGAMKSFASAGFIKKNLKGRIAGNSSPNFLRIPFEILISPPKGLTINDYVLLPMRQKNGEREFEVGPVNKKSGIAKGGIEFGVEKVGDNTFRLVFQSSIGPGEYGILVTRTAGDLSAVSKMRTFRLIL